MNLLDLIKSNLRISSDNTDFDGEIIDLIEQVKADLRTSGVKSDVLDFSLDNDWECPDANIRQVTILYCKSLFGLDNPDKDWFLQQYRYKKSELLNQSLEYGDTNA